MQSCPWSVAELITHSGDKILLDRIVGFDKENLKAEASVKANSVYLKNGVEPAWMGLEYMSQAVAAFAGIQQRQANGEPKVGMLIGTRRYRSSILHYPVGMSLTVETKVLLEDDNGLCVFQCTLTSDEVIAEANLNVFQPPSIQQYLEESLEK